MVSQALVSRTKRHEGLLLRPKSDTKDKYVLGYGHDIPADEVYKYENGITVADAQQWLEEDLEQAEYACKRSVSWFDTLSPIRQEVLIEMVFQMGMGGLLSFKKFLMCLSGGDYTGAYMQGLNSEWHKQTPARCEELMANIRDGVDTYDAAN